MAGLAASKRESSAPRGALGLSHISPATGKTLIEVKILKYLIFLLLLPQGASLTCELPCTIISSWWSPGCVVRSQCLFPAKWPGTSSGDDIALRRSLVAVAGQKPERNIMRVTLFVVLAAVQTGPANAESYSTKDQFGMVRNHATHEDAERIILTGRIMSSSVERGTHSFAIAFDNHIFVCVTPWDSKSHCRSETSEPLFPMKE